jgi:hypothetical protein
MPVPSGPNSVPRQPLTLCSRFRLDPKGSGRTEECRVSDCQLVNVPPLSSTSSTYGSSVGLDAGEPAPDAP